MKSKEQECECASTKASDCGWRKEEGLEGVGRFLKQAV